MTADPAAIRPAATLILWRPGPAGGVQVLMGQRGAGAAFMASKFVFPGGAVDPADARVPLADPLPPDCARRLAAEAEGAPGPAALAAAAARELHEETGLWLAAPGRVPALPGWEAFAARSLAPAAGTLRFVFRAITPPGRPRRFDARFFLAPATAVSGELSDAAGELSRLTWVDIAEARRLDLPFITEVVLAEVGQVLRGGGTSGGVPFFDNRTDRPVFRRLV